MYDGTFLGGDLCNFRITNPVDSDFNDVMFIRLEYIERATAILVKGESLTTPISYYEISTGQDYSALSGSNFFLLFTATDAGSSGDFAFKIWFQGTDGEGVETPTEVTFTQDAPEV